MKGDIPFIHMGLRDNSAANESMGSFAAQPEQIKDKMIARMCLT